MFGLDYHHPERFQSSESWRLNGRETNGTFYMSLAILSEISTVLCSRFIEIFCYRLTQSCYKLIIFQMNSEFLTQ